MLGARRPVRGVALAFLVSCWASQAAALGRAEALDRAEDEVLSVESDLSGLRSRLDVHPNPTTVPEKRIAAGELSLRIKDYERAIDVFSQVVELHRQGKASDAAHADALYLLGDAYYESKQLLSARRRYTELLELADKGPYASYAGRSLARLVDVALHTETLETLDALAERAARIRLSDANGSFAYARGKLEFARGDLVASRALLTTVPAATDYHHQAQYLLGTISLKEALAQLGRSLTPSRSDKSEAAVATISGGSTSPTISVERFAGAITQFQTVTRLPADTPAHRHVIDLAWMAIGRLLYESDNFLDSAEAYSHVDRTSEEFNQMLYELAWVYVRLGDYQRAQRALEILAISGPDTLDVADGSLLRADLLLRSGRFEGALEAYQGVRDRFDPARDQVERFIGDSKDPAVYYDRLVEDSIAPVGTQKVPDVVLGWVRDEARSDRVFALIDDVAHARDILRRSRALASKLNAVLSAPTRARAFPELKAGLEKTLALVNRLALVRRDLALGLDDADGSRGRGGELASVRDERRKLMERLNQVPVTEADFARRQEVAERSWGQVSQALQRVTLESDKLQALINGLKRVLSEYDKHGVTRDSASRRRFEAEVLANERDLEVYRERIERFRADVETGRVQVGFGDRRYVEDERVREKFRRLLERELGLLASGRDEASDYAKRVAPVLTRVSALEQRLAAVQGALDAQVAEGAQELVGMVSDEAAKIEVYTEQLDALDQHARILVGEVAMKNFASVRDRLKSIVLRADVGIVQQAWGLREEQRTRVIGLQRQRALEEQTLDDELREVLDDAGEGGSQ
jgi:tetratricopeptide (TPR) repeat protein